MLAWVPCLLDLSIEKLTALALAMLDQGTATKPCRKATSSDREAPILGPATAGPRVPQ